MERTILTPGHGVSNPLKQVLPGRLLLLRRIHSLSQSQAAEKIGIYQSQLSAIEAGQVGDIMVHQTLGKIWNAFGVSADYLLGLEFRQDLVRGFYDQGVLQYYTVEMLTELPKKCFHCGLILRPTSIHTFPECLLMMSHQGKSFEYLANRYGFSPTSIKMILAEEMRILGR